MRQFATYFPATQRQNLPDKTFRFGKTSFPSHLQSVAERLLISFAPLNCCYHIINKLSLCQPIYRTKVQFLKIVQTTHTFSRFIDYQLFTPYYILNTITVISLLTAKTRLKRRVFLAEKERSVVALQQTSLLPRGIPANFSNLTRYAPPAFYIHNKIQAFFANIKKAILRIRKIT